MTPKSDPPVKKTDALHPRNGNSRADDAEENGNSATNAETAGFRSPEPTKGLGSEAGTVWVSGAIA
jgi:hypothetical protein